VTDEQKPTYEELEELAAAALVMTMSLKHGDVGDALVIAKMVTHVAKPIFDGPVPAWAEAARERCMAKIARSCS